jgi:hypothetical protein
MGAPDAVMNTQPILKIAEIEELARVSEQQALTTEGRK